jgi:hypothetical protein
MQTPDYDVTAKPIRNVDYFLTWKVTMEDLFTKILRTRFGGGKAAAEWGYNLIHALEAHKYDADCEIFLEILRGNLNEDVYYDQMEV